VASSFAETVCVVESPAPLVEVQVYDVPALSVDVVVGAQLEVPLVASLVAHEAVTLLTYQPLFPGVPEIVPTTVGGDASRLALTLSVVELPAASVAVQV
jgi:hypothetical protein